MYCIYCCSTTGDSKVCPTCERAMKQLRLNMSPDHLRELVRRDTAKLCGEQAIDHGIDVTGERYIEHYFTCPHCLAIVGDADLNELDGTFCNQCGQRLAIREEAEAALEARKETT